MPRAAAELTDRLRERLAASVSATASGPPAPVVPSHPAPTGPPSASAAGWDEGALRTVLRAPDDTDLAVVSDPEPDRRPVRDRLAAVRARFPAFERRHVLVVAVILTMAVVAAGFFLLRARDHAVEPVGGGPATGLPEVRSAAPPAPSSPTSNPGSPATTGAPVATIQVHVLGEVRRPGVVQLPAGSRVADAVAAAGGLTARAVTGRLNLAQVLADGQQVFLSGRADPPSEVVGPGAGQGTGASPPAGSSGSSAKVNLNTATAAELEQLPGVGPVTARAIIAWRDQHGPFSSVNQLQQVEGIGAKTFAKLAPLVTV